VPEAYKPDVDQALCIDATDGDTVTIAGPGSGKTATLVNRYAKMLERGIMMSDILNLTFTNAAAAEMVKRVGLLNADQVFRTFHSFAIDLLKRERQYLPFPVCDTIIPVKGEKFELMKSLLKTYPAITTYRSLDEKLSAWKCSNVSPDRALEESYNYGTEFYYACAYRDYEKKCREQGWLDFDSVMRETVKLLETNNEVRLRNQRKYISVDECQDTDVVQFRLLQLIYGGNIFVVGDENQLIYEWRSAQAGNLSAFGKVFPGARTLYLGKNYRSTQRLVSFFKRILPVDNGIASHMVSMREEGVDPTFTRFSDDIEEANIVLRSVKDVENTAIIARTNRQLMTFQKRCMSLGIKSKILGQKDLWQKNEVKHLLDLVKTKAHDPRQAHEVMTEQMNRENLLYKYRNTNGPNEADPASNLNDIIKMAAKRGTIPEFLEWLRKLTYARKSAKNPVLTLTTVHQAKGREWATVFIVGCNQGVMPHTEGVILEEKRIFFVAASRAADFLHISYYKQPSQFILDFLNAEKT
jgi:DNA helicase-2/ATP-dependent DNA helicase PcrA